MESYAHDTEFNFKHFETTAQGLSHAEAKKRLERDGKNVLTQKKKTPAILKFLAQFKDVLIAVLIVSAIISVVLGAVEKSVDEFIDAGIIFCVVIINAIIGYIQERKGEKAMEALKNMTKPYCKVMRNGRSLKIKTEELVVGDIVLLEAGDIVPADLRLIEANSLKIEESALTGESIAVEKDANAVLDANCVLGDRINMAFMSGIVTYGRGSGVVVATGMNTEMGKIASALNEMDNTTTPLTKRLKSTSLIITFVVIAVCIAVFLVQVIMQRNIFGAFSMAIAIAVCAIPEGLPACNTVTLSMGVKRMSDQRAIVKTLPSVETLGSTEVICSDKTGTLTLNKMTVKKIFFMGENCESINNMQLEEKVDGNAVDSFMTLDEVRQEAFKDDKNFSQLLNCMLLCNDTKVRFENDKLESIGDPTEIALVHYGYKMGRNKEFLDGKHKRLNEIPFDSNRKMMSVFNDFDGKIIVYTKGAIDSILSRCTKILDNGKVRRLTVKDKELISSQNKVFAGDALRNLAFACKTVEKIGRPTSENTENDLCFLGLVGMIDPPREEVKDAIKTCKQAGITTIMITGDHKDTAFAIAKELGICTSEEQVITGKELDEFDNNEFEKVVEKYRVYARVSPEHKVKIVNAIKSKDKIVAMTGDGVNDAPSIKAADIGVGMGITGTDVTKEAADLILTDDNFATIVGAVKEGRRIYDTILRILIFQLGSSIAELFLLTMINLIFLDQNFFTPALLLWINFVSDTFMGLSLGFEKEEPDIMKRKPIKNKGNLFKGNVGIQILICAIYVSVVAVVLYCILTLVLKLSTAEVTTVCFLFICLTEQLHTFNLKSINKSLFSKNPFDNKLMNLAFVVSFGLTALLVAVPLGPIDKVMGITAISWQLWLIAIGTSLLIIPFFEIVKLITRAVLKRKEK